MSPGERGKKEKFWAHCKGGGGMSQACTPGEKWGKFFFFCKTTVSIVHVYLFVVSTTVVKVQRYRYSYMYMCYRPHDRKATIILGFIRAMGGMNAYEETKQISCSLFLSLSPYPPLSKKYKIN